MSVADRSRAEKLLALIGYYRLSGYVLHFQFMYIGIKYIEASTSFDDVIERYDFDRRLRSIMIEATEEIEIWIKASLINNLALRHGPHWYTDANLFAHNFEHAKLLTEIERQIATDPSQAKKRSIPVHHYYCRYDDPKMPACWMVFEQISFGTVSVIFKNLKGNETLKICKDAGFHYDVLSSWLHSFSYVRNLCAHHSRLWNRTFTLTPKIPKATKNIIKHNNTAYAQILFMRLLQSRIYTDSAWPNKLKALCKINPVMATEAGFPNGWENLPAWQ